MSCNSSLMSNDSRECSCRNPFQRLSQQSLISQLIVMVLDLFMERRCTSKVEWSLNCHRQTRKKKLKTQMHAFAEVSSKLKPRQTRCNLVVRKKKMHMSVSFAMDSAGVADGKCDQTDFLLSAFQSHPCSVSAALQLGVSRRTVQRTRAIVAQFILEFQVFFQCLIALATMCPPLFCITREAWDETFQVFRFQPPADNAASECRSRWEMMVLRCSVCIGWGSGSGKPPMRYEFLVPPVVLPSTSASNMYYALRYHQHFMYFQSCLHTLREKVFFKRVCYGNRCRLWE